MKTIHGGFGTPEYNAWRNMLGRCLRPSHQSYKYYGARGIAVCDEWRRSFPNFIRDIGPRPTPKHSMDRIDNNGDYEPGNVRWATRNVQIRNTRKSVVIEADGRRMNMEDWAARLGTNSNVVGARLARGWSPERAATEPVAPKQRLLTLDGRTLNIAGWAKFAGVKKTTMEARLRAGWSLRRAVVSATRGQPRI